MPRPGLDTGRRCRVFWNGDSQAVRLPKGLRPDVDEVLIRREGSCIVLEPTPCAWSESFLATSGAAPDIERPGQPPLREREALFP